ncbi:MAG: pentapeptide repeat-containing protein [Nitrosomonas sp.]|nr:pentapeptide repeat-containing protein [Nitrosomonas sp.]
MNFLSRLHPSALAHWFSKKTSQKTDDGETTVQNGQKEHIEKIEALLESVNSASQHVRNFYITFLLAGFYIAVIIWSTTDVMLLKDTPVNLPILNVELPITGFYQFAPYFFLLLHFNLLLQLCLLADKIHRFDHAVIRLGDENARRYYYTQLFAFAFTHTLSGRQHSGLLRLLLTLLVWITINWLPLVILIGLQVGFLAYHDADILLWQRVAIILDLLILAIFWPIIRSVDGNGLNWIKQATGLPWLLQRVQRLWVKTTDSNSTIKRIKPSDQPEIHTSGRPVLEGSFSAITVLSVLIFSWAVAVLPDSAHEKFVAKIIPTSWLTDEPLSSSNIAGERYFRLTEYFFDQRYVIDDRDEKQIKGGIFNRNLILREQLLIANELSAEDEADVTSDDEKKREAALKKVRGLILSERDFRYADFSQARLPKVDFVGANGDLSDLSHANFSAAMLTRARMTKAELQGADLSEAKLQGADLRAVQLQGAKLSRAELQSANLGEAQLQGADLNWAKLQGAELSRAELQSANLGEAQLQGADLRHAKLQGTDLSWANLQGADLSRAKLQGANLSRAKLQGANLSRAELQGTGLWEVELQGAGLTWANLQGAILIGVKLQGADLSWTRLQGSDLRQAELQGANLSWAGLQGANLTNANLSLTVIDGLYVGILTEQSVNEWIEQLAIKIKDDVIFNRIRDRLSSRAGQPTTLSEAIGKQIFTNAVYGVDLHTLLFGFGNELYGSTDLSAYLNSLHPYLISQACENKWAASGIIRNQFDGIRPGNVAAQCMLSLKDQMNLKGEWICPALSEISDDTLRLLKAIATRKTENTIQLAFECKTDRSDLPAESIAPKVPGEAYE